MTNFEQRLRSLKSGSDIVLDEYSVTSEQLITQAQIVRENIAGLTNKKIAMCCDNVLAFITGLIAFDGHCAELYLCGPDSTKSLAPDVQLWCGDTVFDLLTTINISSHDFESSAVHPVVATNWYLLTSGTSGTPKWFSHRFADLIGHTKHSSKLAAVCWANLYQPHRFAGLQVLLQGLLSGAKIVHASTTDVFAQLRLYDQHKVSAISATPSMWRKLLMTNQLQQLALSHVTLGGEIADQAILNRLSEIFLAANIRHIYASTEAGVGFVVSDKKAGFPSEWLKNGINGTELRIDENQHLRIKARVLLDKNLLSRIDQDGFLDTEDKVELSNDRVLFLGRVSGVINVGGNKVHPEKVEAAIMQVEDIQQVRVYAKANSVMGALVVADVVVKQGTDWTLATKNVREKCKLMLQRFEIPIKLNQVDSIEVDPSGKLSRSSDNG